MLDRVRETILSTVNDEPPDTTWGPVIDEEDPITLPVQPLKLRPRRSNPGLAYGPDLAKELHNYREGDWPFSNASETSAFEFWYEDGELETILIPGGQFSNDRFQGTLRSLYPRTATVPRNEGFPTIPPDHYVKAGTASFEEKFFLPLARVEDVNTDPLDRIGNAIAVETLEGEHTIFDGDQARFVFQVLFKPADEVWTQRPPLGIDMETVAEKYQEGKYKSGVLEELLDQGGHVGPSADDKLTARVLNEQYGMPGFYVGIRLLAATPGPVATQAYYRDVKSSLTALDSPFSGQSLEVHDAPEDELETIVRQMRERDMGLSLWDRMGEQKTMMTPFELGNLFHLPSDNTIKAIDWATMDQGNGVPDELPDFWTALEEAEITAGAKTNLQEISGMN